MVLLGVAGGGDATESEFSESVARTIASVASEGSTVLGHGSEKVVAGAIGRLMVNKKRSVPLVT